MIFRSSEAKTLGDNIH